MSLPLRLFKFQNRDLFSRFLQVLPTQVRATSDVSLELSFNALVNF